MKAKRTATQYPKPIRVGVIGVGRGSSFASGATDLVGLKLVALCDTWEEKLREAGKRYGVAMSSVGILAWKSALQDGAPFDVPDFRREASRKAFENDHWSPFPKHAGPGQPPPSIRGFVEPSVKSIAAARQTWAKQGYRGD